MDLEQECQGCDGTGREKGEITVAVGLRKRRFIKKETVTGCGKCKGRGKIPTDFGRKLLDFLKDYLPWESDLRYLEKRVTDLE